MDADGDLDLLTGRDDGTVVYVENTGDALSPEWGQAVFNYGGIDVGNYSTPELVDIDADGDLDLFSGSHGLDIYMYENIGTPNLAVWGFTGY